MDKDYRRLLRDVLLRADTGASHALISDERLHQLIRGQPPSPQERHALLFSGATRDRLSQLSAIERARALRRWGALAVRAPAPVCLMAAAPARDAIAPQRITGNLFSVDLVPTDIEGRTWRISVEIAPELIAITPGGFRLVDSDGLEWLRGNPDAHGELVGFWHHDEPPLSRLSRVELSLQPA